MSKINYGIVGSGERLVEYNVPDVMGNYSNGGVDLLTSRLAFAVTTSPENPDGLVKDVTNLFSTMGLELDGAEYREPKDTSASTGLVCRVSRHNGSVEVYGFVASGKAVDGTPRKPYAATVENTLLKELGFERFPLRERAALKLMPVRDYFSKLV